MNHFSPSLLPDSQMSSMNNNNNLLLVVVYDSKFNILTFETFIQINEANWRHGCQPFNILTFHWLNNELMKETSWRWISNVAAWYYILIMFFSLLDGRNSLMKKNTFICQTSPLCLPKSWTVWEALKYDVVLGPHWEKKITNFENKVVIYENKVIIS